jgi:hypothetical protein
MAMNLGIARGFVNCLIAPFGDAIKGIALGRNFINSIASKLVELADKIVANNSQRIANSFGNSRTVSIYIDDIDRGWSASKEDITNISALLNAIRDISGTDRRIIFRIGLRTDVYFLVRTSDESTDKIERNVIWLRWTNHEILVLAARRIETFFGTDIPQENIYKMTQRDISDRILSKVIEPKFSGVGHWSDRPIHNVLLSLTRARPRDLVKLFHGAARRAFKANKEIISAKNLDDSFESYSNERLQDIINEFRSELPEIDRLLLEMRPTKKQRKAAESYLFSTD